MQPTSALRLLFFAALRSHQNAHSRSSGSLRSPSVGCCRSLLLPRCLPLLAAVAARAAISGKQRFRVPPAAPARFQQTQLRGRTSLRRFDHAARFVLAIADSRFNALCSASGVSP